MRRELYAKDWARYRRPLRKGRKLKWIPLYLEIWDNPDFCNLAHRDKLALIFIWQLCDPEDGRVPQDPIVALWWHRHALRKLPRSAERETLDKLYQRLNHFFGAKPVQKDGLEVEIEIKEEKIIQVGSGLPTKYAFEVGCIRLKQDDLRRWEHAFKNINVCAELEAMADWAQRQPNWFQACAGLLAKRDREALHRKSHFSERAEPFG